MFSHYLAQCQYHLHNCPRLCWLFLLPCHKTSASQLSANVFYTSWQNSTVRAALCALLLQPVQVDMMSRNFKARDLTKGAQPIRYADVEGQYRAVRLPYKGSTGLAAVFVLPDPKYKSVFEAAGQITGAAVLDRKKWMNIYDIGSLSVSVPRFKVSVSQLSLTKVWCGVD